MLKLWSSDLRCLREDMTTTYSASIAVSARPADDIYLYIYIYIYILLICVFACRCIACGRQPEVDPRPLAAHARKVKEDRELKQVGMFD